MTIKDIGPEPQSFDLEQETVENSNYRTVVWSGRYLQLTLMSIPEGGDIGLEVLGRPAALVTNDNLPTFPIEALPPVVADMVLAVTEANQVPVDLPAITGLAALSASLVGRVKLCLNPSWSETINVLTLV